MTIFLDLDPCRCGGDGCSVCNCAAVARRTRTRRVQIAGDRARTLETNVKRALGNTSAPALECEA